MLPGGSDGIDPNAPYDPGMMQQDNYGNQPMAGTGDDGYWPPAPDLPGRSGIQQGETGQPLASSARNNGDYRPMPAGNVGEQPQAQPARKSTTLLDIIMGNSQ